MLTLFFSLYISMFTGSWTPLLNMNGLNTAVKDGFNAIGYFLTSIFNNVDTPMDNLGERLFVTETSFTGLPIYLNMIAFILALITSIGIVVMAVKGVKKAFGIFFMGIRR